MRRFVHILAIIRHVSGITMILGKPRIYVNGGSEIAHTSTRLIANIAGILQRNWGLSMGRNDKRHGPENSWQSSPKIPTSDRNWQKNGTRTTHLKFLFIFFATETFVSDHWGDKQSRKRATNPLEGLIAGDDNLAETFVSIFYMQHA